MRFRVLAAAFIIPLGFSLACGAGDEDADGTEEGADEGDEEKDGGDEDKELEGAGTKDDPYILDCATKARDIATLKDGMAFVKCPEACTSGSLYGTCTYTYDSAVCVAANHSGALKGSPYPGGLTVATHAPGITEGDGYIASTQGDISSSKWSSYDDSLSFKRMSVADCASDKPKKKKPGGGARKGKRPR